MNGWKQLMLGIVAFIIIAGIVLSAYNSDSDTKSPLTVSISSPTAGDAFQGNFSCHLTAIRYSISGGVLNYAVKLYYTPDTTDNYIFTGYDNRTAPGEYSYPWRTPLITSTDVRIRINVTDSNLTEAVAFSSRFEIDSTPPNKVTDLVGGNAANTSITLTWTAPGDDGNTGTASSYDIRYNNIDPITDANWDISTQIANEPAPSAAGTAESFIVPDLSPGTKYYFALKSVDNVGLSSNISNCATASTLLDVVLISPIGGEAWKGNTTYPIHYRIASGETSFTVKLYYTYSGLDFIFIGYDNQSNAGTYQYPWLTPSITSKDVIVRVNVIAQNMTEAYSLSDNFEIDSIPPSGINDLTATDATKTSITLTWTAPGDDGNTGTASSCDIRYNNIDPITDANWDISTQIANEPAPSAAGTAESFIVTDLSPGTKYYFALRSTDNVGLISNISNCASASTLLEVTLISPIGNETWKGGTNYTIDYKIAGTEPPYAVKLYYAYNASEFELINQTEQPEATTYHYTWSTPTILSINVKVKINVTDNTSITDEKTSDAFEIDSLPPGSVTDLTVSSVGCDYVSLTWTAPGEDGELYKFNVTNDESQDLEIPDYDPMGVTSYLTVNENILINKIRVYLRINHTYIGNLIVNLSCPDNTTITLFNRTGGNGVNIWGWYEGNTFTPETNSGNPVPVDDLSVFNNKGSKGIWKLCVSDNVIDYTGEIDYWKIEFVVAPVTMYDIRYNENTDITEANWDTSLPCTNVPIPAEPGTTEAFTIPGLSPGVKYYFALKSIDNVNWESDLSNCANGTTLLHVEVLSPNGGEIWSGKSSHFVRYKFSGAKPDPYSVYEVSIYYTYDNVTEHIVNLSHNEPDIIYEFEWSTPILNSTNVKVLVNVTTYALYSYGQDESDGNFTFDSTIPYVTSAPSNISILSDEIITIEFSEPMNKTSVEQAFSIIPAVENISFAWNTTSTAATIYHDNFIYNTKYDCSINKTAKDISDPGNVIAEFYNFSFTAVEKLSCEVLSPNGNEAGNEAWNGTMPLVIQYKISGGAPPYNISFYWVNATDPVDYTVLIGFESRLTTGTYAFSWPLPGITNNTLKIKIIVADNTTPAQQTIDMSDWTFEIDSTAPGKPLPESPAVDSIAKEGYPRAHAVKLNWLASGDDENIGKATYYHIRYATQPVNESNWDNLVVIPSSQRFNYSASAESGAFDSYIIFNLQPDTTYYFAVKAYDNVGFASQISDCLSIRTLKEEIWGDTIVTTNRNVADTEIHLTGNLYIRGTVTLNLTRVLLNVESTVDFKYRIEVGASLPSPIGGRFDVYLSNITASYSYFYLLTVWPEGDFYLRYSSVNYCGGKAEDIPTEYFERGLEIFSSDVYIDNSIVADGRGVFIYASIPDITETTFRNNYYGVKFESVMPTEGSPAIPAYVNLVACTFVSNAKGVLCVGSRLRLTDCTLLNNTYGAIYNNTPTDFPHNISGVIYHSVFEGNTYALTGINSSLELTQTDFLSNTRIPLDGESVSNHLYYTIYCKNTPINIADADILSNAYAYWNNSVLTDTSMVTLYCENSALNITNANISDNNGAFYKGTTIIDTKEATSAFSMDTISTTIYHKNSIVSITNTIMQSNGKPFYSENSNYIIRAIAPNGTVEEEVLVGDIDGSGTVGNEDAMFYDQDPSGTILYHLATVYAQSSALEFRNNTFEWNLEGILCLLAPYLVVDGCTMTGDGWHTTMGFISTSRLAYGVISIGAPVTFTNNYVYEYISGIVVSAGEINFTGNTFYHVLLGVVLAGSPNIPTILPAPRILFQDLWSTLATINVNANVAKNTFEYNGVGIIAGYSNLIMDDNSFTGKGWSYIEAYEGGVCVLAASSTIKMNNTRTYAPWIGVLSAEVFYFTFGEAVLNLTFLQFENVTYGASDITITNSTLEYLLEGADLAASTLTVYDSTIINQCLYSIYSESSTISFKNVVIPSGFLYFGDYYGYMECRNSTVTIQDSSISLIDEMLFYKSEVSVTNTDFINNTDALKCDDSEVTVSDSYFERNSKGIAVCYGDKSTLKVSNTEFYGNSYGIYVKGLTSTKGPYIEIGELGRNVFADNWKAIYCELGVTGTIKNNEITSKFYGISVSGTARDLEIKNNSIRGGSVGVYIGESVSKSLIVANNTIRDCSGAGIYSSGSCAEIVDNKEISNTTTGINLMYNSALNISGNTIKLCTNGIYCDKTSTLNATGNSIMSAYYGINSLSEKSPLVKGNTIVSCTYGIYNFPSGGITGNTISMNIYGIALRNSNASIYDSTISNCSYGIYSFKSSPTVSNTVVNDSKLYSEYYSTECYSVDNPPVVVGTPQNVFGAPDNKYAILSDGTYLGAYGYIVEGTGTIEKVEIGCKWHTVNLINDYMLLRYSLDWGATYGATNYTDSTQYNSDVTHYLDITSDRGWTWSDLNSVVIEVCHIENPGYVSYIYVDSVWLRITSSYGMYFYSCPDPSKPGAAPQLINSTLNTGNATIQDILFLNSKIDAINSSFSNINFSDAASELRIYFYLTVSVKWQTGESVENATVVIYNKYNLRWDAYNRTWSEDLNITSGYTAENGAFRVRLPVNYMNATTERTYQPYTINASIYDLSDNKTLWVNATDSVNVWNATCCVQQQYAQLYSIQHNATIFDLINPTLYINQIPFSLTNAPQLSLSGRATDNIGIWRVQINTNNGSWSDAALKVFNSTYGNYTVEWSAVLVLQEGSNYIQVKATDTTHSNTATRVAGTVVLDTTAPSIELLSPKYNATNQSSVVIELRINGEPLEEVTLYINDFSEVFHLNETGVAVRNNTVALAEGTNALSISVSDILGNENRMSVIIFAMDQKAPESFIIIPAYEYVNSISEVRVSATDDISGVACVKIRIQKGSYYWGGSSWDTTETWLNTTFSAGGYWRYSWSTANDAEYNISTFATDKAGNTETPHYKKFVYDTTKPFIELSIPANFTTEFSNITISGRTEIGANVTINNLPVYVDGNGDFSISLELGDGMNNFTLYAEDRAGNTNEIGITIEKAVKVQPPQPSAFAWVFVAAAIAVAVIAGVVLVKKLKKPARKPGKETAVKDETREKVAETRYF